MTSLAKKIAAVLAFSFIVSTPVGAAEVRDIAFPVEGGGTFTDDFADARYGHTHEGNDIHAPKLTHALAAVDGVVDWLTETQQSYGWLLSIRDSDGYTYHYIHINNDTPGTDDGNGGRGWAFAPGIEQGARVSKGQFVAYVGDSGNAENIGSHLHFEIRRPDGTPIDPYQSLMALLEPGGYAPATATASSGTINDDLRITASSGVGGGCVSGSLIRTVSSSAVYYCGANGKRYVFPNDKTYFTWYADFSGVKTISDEEMSALTIGGNVTYRPGVRLVKIQIDPKVYAVDSGGVLRLVGSATLAAQLYGAGWAKKVDDIPEAFFINYKLGDPILSAG